MNNHDRIKQAFGGLKAPDGLAERIVTVPQKRLKIGRVVLVGIILVLLTTNVFAFVIPAIQRNRTFVDGTEEKILIISEAIPHSFSENLREYLQNNVPTDIYQDDEILSKRYEITFNSFDEASEFFGISFIQPILGFEWLIKGIIFAHTKNDSAFVYLFTEAVYDSGIQCTVRFDINDCSNESREVGHYIESQIAGNTELYISPMNGIEMAIVTFDLSDYFEQNQIIPQSQVAVQFSIDDIIYHYTITEDKQAVDDYIDSLKGFIDSLT